MRVASLRLGVVLGVGAILVASTVVRAAETGSISGTVTDSSGAALARICVSATSGAEPPFGFHTARTDAAGAFRLDGIPAGPAKVHFERCPGDERNVLGEYFDGKPDAESADAVTVVAGEATTGVNARLRPGGVITGRLTDSSGRPLRTACASGFPADPEPYATSVDEHVDSQGRYRLTGLPTGPYKVSFGYAFAPGAYCQIATWHPAGADHESAEPVPVTAGQTTDGIDAQLPGGALEGRVTDSETGAPVAGVCVSTSATRDGQASGSGPSVFALTGADGRYAIEGLSPGPSKVHFDAEPVFSDVVGPCSNFGSRHFSEWYKDASGSEGAASISITEGGLATGIDGTLTPDSSIAGTVTDTAGRPLDGICVALGDVRTRSGPDGSFTFDRLRSGTYTVAFGVAGEFRYQVIPGGPRSERCPETHVTQYYAGKPDPASADPIELSVGAEATGIDARLEERPQPGPPDEDDPIAVIDPPEVRGASARRATRVRRSGRLVLRGRPIDCRGAGPACTVSIRVARASRPRRRRGARTSAARLGGSRYAVAAGRRGKARARLNRRARRALRRRGRMRVVVTVRVSRADALARRTLRTTLLAPRRRR